MIATYYVQRQSTYIWYIFRRLEGIYGSFTELAAIETCKSAARREARLMQLAEAK